VAILRAAVSFSLRSFMTISASTPSRPLGGHEDGIYRRWNSMFELVVMR